MDCTLCTVKGCRTNNPCTDYSHEYIDLYQKEETLTTIRSASKLVDDGRAGTLSRLEEIAAYAEQKNYQTLGVAYCYGMEKEAVLARKYLKKEGFNTVMVSCTVDGLKESQIDSAKSADSVSCNPLGQANILNSSNVDFTILMGLCLGHDILIQKSLTMDFTTWLVKDRVNMHRPMDGLPGYQSVEDAFMENMDNSFNLISWDILHQKVKESMTESENEKQSIAFLDIRNETAHEKDGISGSIQCLMKDLPSCYKSLLPDKGQEIIIYCNGGMQSLYVVMYLSIKGYQNVKSLAGGYSSYLEKTNLANGSN